MNREWVRDVWERKYWWSKAIGLLLSPVSFLYALGAQIRNALYSWGWLPARSLDRPVVSIGNLTVGGTGKTPSCIWLALELTRRGFKVGVLSRGYPRKESSPIVIVGGIQGLSPAQLRDEASRAGDEPSMMARIYGQTVAVGKNRHGAALELLRRMPIDVFILDDGYQHRKLKRDVEVLLLGRDVSGRVLPRGPFREPRRALRRADLYLLTGAQEEWRRLLPEGGQSRSYAAAVEGVALVGFEGGRWQEFPLSLLYRSKILTVTGIADPSGFYRMIDEWEGDIVDALRFSDHHDYTAQDWQQISRRARTVEFVLTTEKDILKLIAFPFARGKLFALRVAMRVESGERLVEAIVEKISGKAAPSHPA